MDLEPFLEGDLTQRLVDRLRQVQTCMDDGWPFGPRTGRASGTGTFSGSPGPDSSHGSPAGFLLGLKGVVAQGGASRLALPPHSVL